MPRPAAQVQIRPGPFAAWPKKPSVRATVTAISVPLHYITETTGGGWSGVGCIPLTPEIPDIADTKKEGADSHWGRVGVSYSVLVRAALPSRDEEQEVAVLQPALHAAQAWREQQCVLSCVLNHRPPRWVFAPEKSARASRALPLEKFSLPPAEFTELEATVDAQVSSVIFSAGSNVAAAVVVRGFGKKSLLSLRALVDRGMKTSSLSAAVLHIHCIVKLPLALRHEPQIHMPQPSQTLSVTQKACNVSEHNDRACVLSWPFGTLTCY
ncbi:hypothetical protein JZ751_026838 [Albula glossodonta]|uniref:Uncharacterized protein n=1 Tax=Albula glossodonta TaxID=121402 RepID=A0A8T2PD69_9TELE|nr:hypothetical protein JZ751_026838 [Albula glossodonta]